MAKKRQGIAHFWISKFKLFTRNKFRHKSIGKAARSRFPSDSRLRETYTCWQGKSEKSKKLSRKLREEIGLLHGSQRNRQVAMMPLWPSASFVHPKEKVMRPIRWQTVLGIAVLGPLMFPPLPAWGRQ